MTNQVNNQTTTQFTEGNLNITIQRDIMTVVEKGYPTYVYQIVETAPIGYEVWNIGSHMPKDYIPYAQCGGYDGRQVNRDTLKAVFIGDAKETITLINGNGEHFEKAPLNIRILSKLNSTALKFIEDNTNLKFKSDGYGNLEAFPESNNQLAVLLTMYSWKTQLANDFVLLKICSHEEFYNN